VLSWIDICAGLAAKTFSRGPCVTASVDAVHFLRPCHVSSQLAMQAGRQADRQAFMPLQLEHAHQIAEWPPALHSTVT
jgi:acyl-CoA hydrolase